MHYSPAEKNKMTAHFVLITDGQFFVLNEAAVSPNTKKATTFV
jgi:hypothetical protein